MNDCKACIKMEEIDSYFDEIFDFLDENDLPYGELPFVRMDIHRWLASRHNV
jgi:hypothetical protein